MVEAGSEAHTGIRRGDFGVWPHSLGKDIFAGLSQAFVRRIKFLSYLFAYFTVFCPLLSVGSTVTQIKYFNQNSFQRCWWTALNGVCSSQLGLCFSFSYSWHSRIVNRKTSAGLLVPTDWKQNTQENLKQCSSERTSKSSGVVNSPSTLTSDSEKPMVFAWDDLG